MRKEINTQKEMKAFVVCLYDWDWKCDQEEMRQILAVYDTLEKAAHFSCSTKLHTEDEQIEIVEFHGSQECQRYTKTGKPLES